MIVAFKTKLEIGAIETRLIYNHNKDLFPMGFLVLRESNFEEWKEYAKSVNVNLENMKRFPPSTLFYEII